ncbi:MAG: 5-formyltetrahydrofolate cyclo-ligase [Proteobacteria bacterium]|nr:5-formyltetrahydrofolate cyclo-ligase [Desulfobacteraceae bacterium]MBU2520711.1 5-formyltetrahydrofolate cyclo-ligase [Pseudomonadota bacterium]MBU3980883.1 5-formyltetrahydrofolate cyclo-ligase [Pseudomonadota bacterium]MBU4012799.1 5-formyltetrahydrofolate cyclo-ligase [Pseudomonadota bacterium]MBU4067621.1 5-formyltetrahydrofolate cyclo-ligase [Pseudomonadota bacterium]
MEEIREKKQEVRNNIAATLEKLSDKEIAKKTKQIEDNLFEFANFLEAKIVLLYINKKSEVASRNIIKRCFDFNKIVILPAFNIKTYEIKLMKVDDLDNDLITGPRGILEPDINRCKIVPVDRVDLALIPGIAFDEKGGRIGSGEGYYDRFIPKLSITTRKVAIALECQIIQQVPVESHDIHVDIIITDERIIYKI